MKRYYRQTDRFRCGPIAIMNTLRWSGCEYPFSDFKEELDLDCLAPYYPQGTMPWDFHTALRKWSYYSKLFTIEKFYYRSTLKALDGILKRGNAAIIHYDWGKSCHYSFAFDKTPCFYWTANHSRTDHNKETQLISRKAMSKDFKFNRSESWLWEISRGSPPRKNPRVGSNKEILDFLFCARRPDEN